MKRFLNPFIALSSCLLSVGSLTSATSISETPGPVATRTFTVLDERKIAAVKASLKKKGATYVPYYQTILKSADKQLTGKLTSVVTKTQTPPSGDKHDYLSLAPYWWPDPAKPDGLPWIRKDGQVNPLTRGENVDQPAKDGMFKQAETLATAYYFSDNRKYAERAIEVLQTWFLKPETRMNPNLNFGQGVPGVSTGRGFGIIEFTSVIDLTTTIEMLREGNALDQKTDAGLVSWLTEYVNWLQTGKLALEEKATMNNHGTWYDAQVVAILLFLKRDAEAKAILESTTKKRIDHQLEADGSQPEELARTKSLSYSIMNLNAFTHLAYFGKLLNVDLWNYKNPKGGSIQKAYEFLQPYAEGKATWTREQLGDLDPELDKLRRLFVDAGSMMNKPDYCAFASSVQNPTNLSRLTRPCE